MRYTTADLENAVVFSMRPPGHTGTTPKEVAKEKLTKEIKPVVRSLTLQDSNQHLHDKNKSKVEKVEDH